MRGVLFSDICDEVEANTEASGDSKGTSDYNPTHDRICETFLEFENLTTTDCLKKMKKFEEAGILLTESKRPREGSFTKSIKRELAIPTIPI